jgi:7,8-dihydro-6-hydroxymethylpterin-pyrophosphokinase
VLGRDFAAPRHSPRPLDVDLLLLGDAPYRSERLSLPHEQATERRFVLIPLVELDPELTTPDGLRLADRLAELPVDEGVRLAGPPLRVPGA